MVKTCSKCKVEKPFSEFHKNTKAKDGLQNECKGCRKTYIKAHYQANKDKQKEKMKAYQEANKDKIKQQRKVYYEANKDKYKAHRKAYYEANKELIKAQKKEYREANKDKINAQKVAYLRERRKTDPLFKLKHSLRSRTLYAFKNKGYRKNTKTQEMLGVSWEIAKAHIERQFKKGMSWDNYGEWHIDHIIPLASANTEKQLMRLCHYTNLQPLWAEENLSKSAMILGQQTMLRI